MILSNPESDYDSRSDGEDARGLPADSSTLKSHDGKESWSMAPITSRMSLESGQSRCVGAC